MPRSPMSSIRVHAPTARSATVEAPVSPALKTLKGKVVGLLDNTKQNAGLLLARTAEHLKRHHGVKDAVARIKPMAGPASPETIEFFKKNVDFVVAASAD